MERHVSELYEHFRYDFDHRSRLFTVPYFFMRSSRIIVRLTVNGGHLHFRAGVRDYSGDLARVKRAQRSTMGKKIW